MFLNSHELRTNLKSNVDDYIETWMEAFLVDRKSVDGDIVRVQPHPSEDLQLVGGTGVHGAGHGRQIRIGSDQ